MTRTDPGTESSEPTLSTKEVGPDGNVAAKPLDPPASPTIAAAQPLLAGSTAEAPLPIPTTLATTRSTIFVFGRTRAGYVVRTQPTKGKSPTWSLPAVAVPSFDDDAPAVATPDGELSWFAVSSPTGGLRVVRVDATPNNGAPKLTTITKLPSKLGRVSALVPLKAHVAVIGREGNGITFARLDRAGGFLDATAKVIATGSASQSTTSSRSPRATNEDDRVLLAWDGDDVPGALECPGTTAAERAAPKSGIYVRRFHANGEPASPARRLTRPAFEAHTLDVVVELGACAVLASTAQGFEMFRFVRKGDDLGPYGGGLHLASPGSDVSLGADVIGTIGVTSQKLLRIGPGIKIVPSPLGFAPPSGGSFDRVQIAMDGYGAHVVFGTNTGSGTMPTIARVDGEHMGPVLPTPWIGPSPQHLVFAARDGDEALAIAIEGGAVQALRLSIDGKPTSSAALPIDPKQTSTIDWPRPPVPRAARAGGEWVVALADGRALVVTGAKAGTFVAKPPKAKDGFLALAPTNGKASVVRAIFVPSRARQARLWTATIDPKTGLAAPWTEVPGSEHYYGAIGVTRTVAAARRSGGLWLVTNAGPNVPGVAQTYGVLSVDQDGALSELDLDAPAPVQEIALVPSTIGAAIVATLTGKGVATRWLDGPAPGWRDGFAFMPFRVRGEGPVLREKSAQLVLPGYALPVDLGPTIAPFLGDRCPFVMETGPRALLLACEEGAEDAPLAAKVTTRVVRF